MSVIQVTSSLSIPESELSFRFIRASGPGGQNVNKVATAVQLRYDVRNASLPEAIKERLESVAGKKLSEEGILVITARRFRSQEKNRQDAIQRLVELIRKATEVKKPRKKTRPSRAWHEKRLQEKRRRSEVKKTRQPKTEGD